MSEPELRSIALTEIAKRNHAERQMESAVTDTANRKLEVGSTGLKVFSGVITEDHNREWQSPQIYDLVDRMRKGDSTCAAVLLAIVLPVLSTEVRVEAKAGTDEGKPDPVVEEAAEFVHDVLFGGDVMVRPWRAFLREALLYLAYGHYTFEKVFQELTTGPHAGMIAWREFAPRHPRTITEWNTDRHGRLINVRQEVMDSEHQVDAIIPRDKLLLLTNQPEAGNPQGISIFRPAYKHWQYKDGMYAVQAIAIERQGAGVPYASYPAGTSPQDKDDAEAMLQNVAAHEQSYFTYEDDWEVGFIDMGAASTLDPQAAIDHHDGQISKSILASFMQLPQNGKGSFALSSDQSGFFTHSLNEVGYHIASMFNRSAIPQLVDFNYGALPSYPKIRFDRIGHISIDKILEHIAKLAEKGILTSTLELENRVRDMLNLPPVEEEDFEEAKEEEEPPAPIPDSETGGAEDV